MGGAEERGPYRSGLGEEPDNKRNVRRDSKRVS